MEFAFWKHPDGDHVALVDPDGQEWTTRELREAAHQVSRSLQALGVARNDTVAMVLDNEAAVFVLLLATMQIGVYLVPVNKHLTAQEIAYILEDSGSKVVVCSPGQAEACRPAVRDGACLGYCTGPVEGFRAFDDLRTGSVEPPSERWAGGIMNYTSGTTGRPKGVRRPLPLVPPEPITTAYASFLLMYGMKPFEGVHLVVSPLYHTAVLYFASSALHLGQTVVMMDRWTPEAMLEKIQRYRVTSSHMVPTQFVRLLAFEGRLAYDVSSLRHMVHSAAPCPIPVKRKMIEWWGPAVYEYYAATEGGGTMVTPAEWLARPGTVGRPWQTAEIAIFDDAKVRLPAGAIGTVYIKMAQAFEYHRDREKTEKAHTTDGYFTVGDIGYLDQAGYLFLCDRKVDMIISGGVNIYPAEVESVLLEHPRVMDVAVFGIPDADWGEQVKAVVEARGGAEPALAEEILAFVQERLAKFKCPKTIDFVEVMPRDPNGKLAKRKLRDPYWVGVGRAI